MAKKRGFLSKLFAKAKRYVTEERVVKRTSVRGGGAPEPTISEDELGEIIEYAETGEWPDEPVEVYEVEQPAVPTRSYIPGPDPSTLRSGDLLSTAAFYGVTDEEYAELEEAINTAYNDPAATEWERRAAMRDIQNAMSDLYERSKETGDFDWAAWREEHYPKGSAE